MQKANDNHISANLHVRGAAGIGHAARHTQRDETIRCLRRAAQKCHDVVAEVKVYCTSCAALSAQLVNAASVLERLRMDIPIKWALARGIAPLQGKDRWAQPYAGQQDTAAFRHRRRGRSIYVFDA